MIILHTKTAQCGIKAFGLRVLIIFYFYEVWWFGSVERVTWCRQNKAAVSKRATERFCWKGPLLKPKLSTFEAKTPWLINIFLSDIQGIQLCLVKWRIGPTSLSSAIQFSWCLQSKLSNLPWMMNVQWSYMPQNNVCLSVCLPAYLLYLCFWNLPICFMDSW